MTREYVDVIGIGAINYDYMFQCRKMRNKDRIPDNGEEIMGVPMELVEDEISDLYITCKKTYTTQIGGSALLALKTIRAIDASIKIGFVGACGEINDFDRRYGKSLEPKSELAFLDNPDWLFYVDRNTYKEQGCINKAVIRLNKSNTRGSIKISRGANDLLLDMILQKEDEGESFVEYLAQAKWIHISSLTTFEQFEKIMAYVMKAKNKNRFLKVSIDPGDEYTRMNRSGLQKYLKDVDYVFLNEKELDNLVINEDLPENDKLIRLSTYFNNPNDVNTKVFIIKRKNSHKLIDFVNRVPYVYYHRKLAFYKINNDTGSGDCFAGGFIAGMLSEYLIAHQPYAIQLGTLAAKERMKSMLNFSVYENINVEAEKFIMKKYKNGTLNWRQRGLLFFQSKVDFVIGAVASFVVSLVISYIIAILEK